MKQIILAFLGLMVVLGLLILISTPKGASFINSVRPNAIAPSSTATPSAHPTIQVKH